MRCELLTEEVVERFLAWLETDRGCSPATRNQRLAAIRSFCRYLQTRDIERIGQYQRVLAIPKKKTRSTTPRHLSLEGIRLILAQPGPRKPSGRRDLALLTLMYDSGARVQEIADLTLGDLRTDPPATVRLTGKGCRRHLKTEQGAGLPTSAQFSVAVDRVACWCWCRPVGGVGAAALATLPPAKAVAASCD